MNTKNTPPRSPPSPPPLLCVSYSKHMCDVLLFFLVFVLGGGTPADINECKTGRNTCANDTVCFNLDGGYDCRCPHGHNCTGDCIHDGKVKHSGQIWVLDSDRCSVCSCQVRDGCWGRDAGGWMLGGGS